MFEFHALTAEQVLWTIAAVIILFGFVSWIAGILKDFEATPRAADLADDSQIPHDFSRFPVEPTAARLHTEKYSVFEVSHNVLLSKLARALASEGLVISNTPRGTLRVHELSSWHPPVTDGPEECIPSLLRRQAG